MAGRDSGTTGNHPDADEMAFSADASAARWAGCWRLGAIARRAGSAMAGELMLHVACPRQAALDARVPRHHG